MFFREIMSVVRIRKNILYTHSMGTCIIFFFFQGMWNITAEIIFVMRTTGLILRQMC